jgi:hypothetical protein
MAAKRPAKVKPEAWRESFLPDNRPTALDHIRASHPDAAADAEALSEEEQRRLLADLDRGARRAHVSALASAVDALTWDLAADEALVVKAALQRLIDAAKSEAFDKLATKETADAARRYLRARELAGETPDWMKLPEPAQGLDRPMIVARLLEIGAVAHRSLQDVRAADGGDATCVHVAHAFASQLAAVAKLIPRSWWLPDADEDRSNLSPATAALWAGLSAEEYAALTEEERQELEHAVRREEQLIKTERVSVERAAEPPFEDDDEIRLGDRIATAVTTTMIPSDDELARWALETRGYSPDRVRYWVKKQLPSGATRPRGRPPKTRGGPISK